MTLSRFWLYHLMAVTSVTIVFSAYKRKKYQDIYEAAAIRQLKIELTTASEYQSTYYHHDTVEYIESTECKRIAREATNTATNIQHETPPRLFLWYYLHIWMMLFIDCFFTYRQQRMYSYKYFVPEKFICSEYPCTHGLQATTTCYINRSTEKTILILIHTGLVFTSVVLYMVEIAVIGFNQVVRAWFRRNTDWTETILLHDKPKFIRRARGAGYPRTWKYKYSNRRRRTFMLQSDSDSDSDSTHTISSLNSF